MHISECIDQSLYMRQNKSLHMSVSITTLSDMVDLLVQGPPCHIMLDEEALANLHETFAIWIRGQMKYQKMTEEQMKKMMGMAISSHNISRLRLMPRHQ